MAEQRIAQQISRGFSENSEMGSIESTSSVEVDEETRRMNRYMTKQDALNHLSGYPSQWEEIGKNLIDSSVVDKIMNDAEAKGDEAAYIVEEWWSVTTEEDGNFCWEKLKDVIDNLNVNKPTHSESHGHIARIDQDLTNNASHKVVVKETIRNLECEFRNIREEFQTFLQSNRGKCITFCDLLSKPVDSWIGLEDYFTKDELEEMKLEDIFKKLRRNVLNCLDFEVLSFLISQCGCPDLIEKMECYEKRVQSKCSNITVTELVAHWDPPVFGSDIPESFRACVAKMHWNPNQRKVEELRRLRRRFEVLIPQRIGMAAFVLVYILEGSVTALWLVFTNQWPKLIDEIKQLIPVMVQEIQLAVFILDDVILYPCSNREKLWNASREGASKVVRELLQNFQVDPNTVYELYQRTALQCAAKYGQQESATLFLEHGADIDYQDARGCTALMIAVRARQASMAEYLLDCGANINIPDHVNGMSIFLFAVQDNDVQMFELCKKYHADLNARTKDMKTALIIAAENGNEEIVKSLVSEGEEVIDMEAQDIYGRTAIHAAAICGSTKIVKVLLKCPNALFLKDMNNNTPKDIAVKNKNEELEDLFRPYFLEDEPLILQEEEETLGQIPSGSTELIELTTYSTTTPDTEASPTSAGAAPPKDDVPETELKSLTLEKERTGLGSRLKKFGQSVVQSVVHAGNLNVRLIRAATWNDPVLADKLLRKGADPNTRRWEVQMWTPLMIAANKGHVMVAKVLLKHGADPNIVTITADYTALILACKEGNHDIVECLLDPSNPVPLDIEAVNAASGWGPLMWTSQSKFSSDAKSETGIENRCKILQSLVNAGVNINKTVNNGWTPLMQASQDNNLKLVQLMCKIDGIDLDHQSKSTWTAITTACRKGNEDIVIELTEAGADINKKKQGGYTALHMACYKGLLRAVQCMVPSSKQGGSHRRKVTPNVDVQDDWGMTPLMLATKQGHHDVAKYLIKVAQVQVNIQAERYVQWTAVFFAIRNGDEDILDLLVENYADLSIPDENNVSPANYAKSLFINKQMYKLIQHKKEKEKQQKELELGHEEQSKDETPAGKSSSIVDVAKYNQVELLWRARQQIYLTLNI